MDEGVEIDGPNQKELTPKPNEKLEQANKLFSEGVSVYAPEGKIGLHGTSIENFVSMINSGSISSDISKTQTQGESHDDRFYITPYKEALEGTPIYDQQKKLPSDTVYQAAADYSNIAAFHSYLRDNLPGVVDNDWYTHFVVSKKKVEGNMILPTTPEGQLAYDHLLDKAQELGYDKEATEKIIQEAIRRRGIVLAIDLEAAKQHQLFDGERVPGKEIYIKGINLPFNELVTGAQAMTTDTKQEVYDRLALL